MQRFILLGSPTKLTKSTTDRNINSALCLVLPRNAICSLARPICQGAEGIAADLAAAPAAAAFVGTGAAAQATEPSAAALFLPARHRQTPHANRKQPRPATASPEPPELLNQNLKQR